MKAEIKQLLRNLRTAVMLGRSEAINIALDGLLGLPGVTSNQQMNDGFIEQVVLPVGGALAGLSSAQLRPLLNHSFAVGRAIGGVALAHRFVKGHDSTQKDLRQPGNDARPDVRLSLGRSLYTLAANDPEKILSLGTRWIVELGPRLRHTALIFLPSLAPRFETQLLSLLGSLNAEQDSQVNATLVESLNILAQVGSPESVLGLLSTWSSDPHPNSWVICRVLSSNWVIGYHSEVKSILQAVQTKTADSRYISNAIKALARHGLEINL